MVQIDLMKYQDQLRLKTEGGKKYIFGDIRRRWLVLLPEELVRQLVIQFLVREKNYNRSRISTERAIKVNKMDRRFDILVYDEAFRPKLLIECKSPQVRIKQDAFDQIAWYNTSLKVDFLVITNGIETYCCSIDYQRQVHGFLDYFPVVE